MYIHVKPRQQSSNYCWGVCIRAASIRLMDDIREAFILGQSLFESMLVCIICSSLHFYWNFTPHEYYVILPALGICAAFFNTI